MIAVVKKYDLRHLLNKWPVIVMDYMIRVVPINDKGHLFRGAWRVVLYLKSLNAQSPDIKHNRN